MASKIGNTSLAERNLNIGKGCIYKWKREIKLGKNGILENNSLNNNHGENLKKKIQDQIESAIYKKKQRMSSRRIHSDIRIYKRTPN